jgi:hypothetical protein
MNACRDYSDISVFYSWKELCCALDDDKKKKSVKQVKSKKAFSQPARFFPL